MENIKTAEEHLESVIKSDKNKHFPSTVFEEDYAGGSDRYIRDDLVIQAMQEYASLQSSKDKEEIERLKKRIAELEKENIKMKEVIAWADEELSRLKTGRTSQLSELQNPTGVTPL